MNDDLSIPGHPEVFVVGDLAVLRSRGKAVPGVAPAAMQSGRTAARNIVAHDARRGPRARFAIVNKGDLATIGRYRAVGVLAGRHLTGAFAWWTWLFVHIMYLAGFRNRLERAARVGVLVLHVPARLAADHDADDPTPASAFAAGIALVACTSVSTQCCCSTRTSPTSARDVRPNSCTLMVLS